MKKTVEINRENSKDFEFNHCRTNIVSLLARLSQKGWKGCNVLSGSTATICLEIQIILEACYTLGINPLPTLRKVTPQVRWNYLGSLPLRHNLLTDIGKTANGIWAVADSFVTMTILKSEPHCAFILIPSSYHEETLVGGAMSSERERNVARTKELISTLALMENYRFYTIGTP